MEELDEISRSTLQAAGITEDLLRTLSREEIRDLLPGPEHFLRRRAIWQLFHVEQQNALQQEQQANPRNQGNGQSECGRLTVQVTPMHTSTRPSILDTSSSVPETCRTSAQDGDIPKTLQLPNPEYVVYTDSELEQVRKQYFESLRTGEEGIRLSKELRCRLVRNTMTNMVSILRAAGAECDYPSKNEVLAMAKRLVEFYPMLRDSSGSSKHAWESVYNQLNKRLQNIKTPKKSQGPTPQRKKRRRLEFKDHDGDSSTSTVMLNSGSSTPSSEQRDSPGELSKKTGNDGLQSLADHDGQGGQADSRQIQARHYTTLQEMYKKPKPNKEAVSQLLDLEFDARRAFINSDSSRDLDRAVKLLEAYPCFNELDHVMDELQRILDRGNHSFIPELKARWETFYGRAQFYGVFKKLLKPPMTLDGVTHFIAVVKALPEMFPSPAALPKKMGHVSEALIHILEPTENPSSFLKKRPLSSPLLVICETNCMVAIGSSPVTTFPREKIHEGVLYLLAYYYALQLTYPRCIATLLSLLQTEILLDKIHDGDATSSYKKALSEWRKFIGE